MKYKIYTNGFLIAEYILEKYRNISLKALKKELPLLRIETEKEKGKI